MNEERVEMRTLPARKLYSLKGMKVMDFSVGDLTILKVAIDKAIEDKNTRDLESLAMEILVGRRRIKEKVRRLARTVDELLVNEKMLAKGINDLHLSDEERLVLLTTFSEETDDEAERVLERTQGMREARRSIDEALAKARHNVG
ncbi:MAG TPA: hypothetical protein VLY82_01470 [Nitrososphaerales archaeon]|nr:hypothetical protein [Nitrososphaerales archaeon]